MATNTDNEQSSSTFVAKNFDADPHSMGEERCVNAHGRQTSYSMDVGSGGNGVVTQEKCDCFPHPRENHVLSSQTVGETRLTETVADEDVFYPRNQSVDEVDGKDIDRLSSVSNRVEAPRTEKQNHEVENRVHDLNGRVEAASAILPATHAGFSKECQGTIGDDSRSSGATENGSPEIMERASPVSVGVSSEDQSALTQQKWSSPRKLKIRSSQSSFGELPLGNSTPLVQRVELLEQKLAFLDDKNSPKSEKACSGPSTPSTVSDRTSKPARWALEEVEAKGSLLERVAALERKLEFLVRQLDFNSHSTRRNLMVNLTTVHSNAAEEQSRLETSEDKKYEVVAAPSGSTSDFHSERDTEQSITQIHEATEDAKREGQGNSDEHIAEMKETKNLKEWLNFRESDSKHSIKWKSVKAKLATCLHPSAR